MAFRMSTNPQKAEDCSPARPWRAPARQRSLHGNDAVASPTVGTWAGFSLWMSSTMNSPVSPKCSLYICHLSWSMSFASAISQPAFSRPMRMRPMPAKNSAKVFSNGWLITCAGIFASSAGGIQLSNDVLADSRRVAQRMSPKPNYAPARRLERANAGAVAADIARYFLLPVAAIRRGHAAVAGSRVKNNRPRKRLDAQRGKRNQDGPEGVGAAASL